MASYIDCLGCSCLILAREARCPFCGASQHHTAAPSRLGLGLTLGLTLALFGCDKDDGSDDDGAGDTMDDSAEGPTDPTPDAVTYAGPDTDTWDSSATVTSIGDTTTMWPETDADASTYGGPDETDSTSWGETTTTTTTNATSDASTYAGPDETDSVGTSG